VPTIVVVLEVADHHAGVEQVGPVVAVEAGQPTLRQRLRLRVLAALDQRIGRLTAVYVCHRARRG
jgi:hypothetical protein